MASVSDKITSPEYKFSSNVEVMLSGINGTSVVGYNASNEFYCRPKDNNMIKCLFRHEKLLSYMNATEDGEMQFKEIRDEDIFENSSFPFEIGFDKTGVSKIVVSEKATKFLGADMARSLANLINVGVDLSSLSADSSTIEINKMNNFLLGECMSQIKVSFGEKKEDNEKGSWSLNLMSPLPKLSDKGLHVTKSWNNSDCKSLKTFYWTAFVEKGILSDEELTIVSMNIFYEKIFNYLDKEKFK